jgi:hypothetical protein
MDKNKDKDKKEKTSLPEGFLSPEVFKEKYHTNFSQRWPESKLDECIEEDREIYTDVQILTGRNDIGRTNKFFQNGYNKGKKYSTVNKRLQNSFKRFLDEILESGDEVEFWNRWFNEAKNGDAKFAKMFLEYGMGPVVQQVEVKSDGDITFTMDPSKIIDVEKEEDKE